MKIHLCCGDIYLYPGYTNIDIKGKLATKVSKEELEKNKTTLDKYFKYTFGESRREVIVDKKMDITKSWDFEDNSIEEIVAISTIEHFPPKEAKFIIFEIKRILKKDGILIIDFPDIKKTVQMYLDLDPEFCMRLLYCNQKDKYSTHFWGYTNDTFRALWGKNFAVYEDVVVKHDYPMLSYIVIKKGELK